MNTRITKLTVLPPGEPIFCERATNVEIVDEAAGEFLELTQSGDDFGKIRFDVDEWPHIKAAVDRLIVEMKNDGGAS
jgi:hypothetical protein